MSYNEVRKAGGVIVTEGIPDVHISPSQISTFDTCQMKWFYRYFRKIRISSGSPKTVLGLSYDDTLTTNFEQKIVTQEDFQKDELIDVYDTAFSNRKDDIEWNSPMERSETKETGRKIIERVATGIETVRIDAQGRERNLGFTKPLEKMNPVAVQKKREVLYENAPWVMVTISDYEETEEGEDIIVDHKTTAKSRHDAKAEHIFAMDSYAIAKRYTEGVDKAKRRRIDYAIGLKREPRLVQIELPPLTPKAVAHFKQKTATQFQQMELLRQGLMKPNTNESHFLCSKTYCEYHAICELENHTTIKQ